MSSVFILQSNCLVELEYYRLFPVYQRKIEEVINENDRVFLVESDLKKENQTHTQNLSPLTKRTEGQSFMDQPTQNQINNSSQTFEQALEIKYGGKKGRLEIEKIDPQQASEKQQRFQNLSEYTCVTALSDGFKFIQNGIKKGDKNLKCRVLLSNHIQDSKSSLLDGLGQYDELKLVDCSNAVIRFMSEILSTLSLSKKGVQKFSIENSEIPSNPVMQFITQSTWFQLLKKVSFKNSKILGNKSLDSFLNKCKIVSLNVSGTRVDASGILSIATSKYYFYLKQLNFKNIKQNYWALMDFLSIKSNLETLKFDITQLYEYSGQTFRLDKNQNFRRNFTNLRKFSYSGADKEAFSCLNFNHYDFQNLTKLVLSQMELQYTFFQRFCLFEFRKTLTHLDIIDCKYEMDMVECFLQKTPFPELRYLGIKYLTFKLLCNQNIFSKLRQLVVENFQSKQYYPYIENDVLCDLNRIVFQNSNQGEYIQDGFINPKFFRDFIKQNEINEVILNGKLDNFTLFYLFDGNNQIKLSRISNTFRTEFNSVGLKRIAQLMNEQKLDLNELCVNNSENISQKELELFMINKTGFQNIQILDFSGTRITDACVSNLAIHSNTNRLERLILRNCQFLTFESVQLVWKHTNSLWQIDLSGSAITDIGIERIGLMNLLKNLFFLRVNDCQLISREGIKGFIRSICATDSKLVSQNLNLNLIFKNFQRLFTDDILQLLLSNCHQFADNAREIDLSEMMLLTPQKTADLAETMLDFPQVQRLNFIRSNLDDQSLIAFFYSNKFPVLEAIKCSSNFSSISAHLIDEIKFNTKTPKFDYAEFWKENRLSIDDDFLGNVYLSDPQIHPDNFSFLDISYNVKMTKEGLNHLLTNEKLLEHVTYIDISSSDIDDDWVARICKRPIMQKLKNIQLAKCPFITQQSLITLSRCEHFSDDFNLQIFFEQCGHLIDDQVLWEMSFSRYFYNIRQIILNNNYNIEAGLNDVIERLKRMLPIKILDLDNTNITSKTLQIIAASHYLKDLEILSFTHCNKVDKHGIIKLIEGHNFKLKPRLNINYILAQDPALVDEIVMSYLVESDYFHTLQQFDFANMTNFQTMAFRRMIAPLSEKGNIKFFNLKRRFFYDRNINKDFISMPMKSIQHLKIMGNPLLDVDVIIDGIFSNLHNFPNLNMDIFLYDNQAKVQKILMHLSNQSKVTHPIINLNLKGNQFLSDDTLLEFINSKAGEYIEFIDISETTLIFDHVESDQKKEQNEKGQKIDEIFNNPFALAKKSPISSASHIGGQKGIAGSLIEALTVKSKLRKLQGLRIYDIPALNTSHVNLILEAQNYSDDFNMEQIILKTEIIALLDDQSIQLIGKSPYLQNMKILKLQNNKLITEKGFSKLAKQQYLLNIQHMNLQSTLLQRDQLQELMQSPNIQNLIKLRIENKQVAHGYILVAGSSQLGDNFDAQFFFSDKNSYNLNQKILDKLKEKKKWLTNIKQVDLTRALTLSNKRILDFMKCKELENILNLNLQSTKINNESAFVVKQDQDKSTSESTNIKDIMQLISNMKYLGQFNMTQCNSITYTGIVKLLENPSLNEIQIKTQTNIGSLSTMLQIFDTIKLKKRADLSVLPNFMRKLSFENWPISSNDIKILSQSKSVLYVEALNISKTNVGDDGIVAIFSKESRMINLIELKIEQMPQLSSSSLEAIFQSTMVHSSFDITNVISAYQNNGGTITKKFTDSTIMILSYSKLLQNIRILDLSKQINITTFSIAQIASSDFSYNVQVMTLNETAIDDTAILLIANSDKLLQLKELSVKNCQKLTENSINYFLRNQFLNYQFAYESFIEYLIGQKKILEKNKSLQNSNEREFIDADEEDFQLDDQNIVLYEGSNNPHKIFSNIEKDQKDQLENRKKHDRLLNGLLKSQFRRDKKDLCFFDDQKHGWKPSLDTINKYFSQKNYLFLETLNINLKRSDDNLLHCLSESEILPYLKQIYLKNGKYTSTGFIFLLKGKYMSLLDPSSFIQGNGHLIDYPTLSELGKSPLLINCKNLDLQGATPVREDEWQLFFDNLNYLSNNIQTINLQKTQITDEGLRSLFSPNILPSLENIDISENPKITSDPFEFMINQRSKPFINLKALFEKLPPKMFEQNNIQTKYPQIYFDNKFLGIPGYVPEQSFLDFLQNPLIINIKFIKIDPKYKIHPDEIQYFQHYSHLYCLKSLNYPSFTQDFMLALIRNQKIPFQQFQLQQALEQNQSVSNDKDIWIELSQSKQFLVFQTLKIDPQQNLDIETYQKLLRSQYAMGIEQIVFVEPPENQNQNQDSQNQEKQEQTQKQQQEVAQKSKEVLNNIPDFQNKIISLGIIPSQYLKNLNNITSEQWDFNSYVNLIKNHQNFAQSFIKNMMGTLDQIPINNENLREISKIDYFYSYSQWWTIKAIEKQQLDINLIFSNQYHIFTRFVDFQQEVYNEKDLIQISNQFKQNQNINIQLKNGPSITSNLVTNWIQNQHMNPYMYEFYFQIYQDKFDDTSLQEYSKFFIDPDGLRNNSYISNSFCISDNKLVTYRGIRSYLNQTPNRFEEINLSGMKNMNDRVLTEVAKSRGVTSCSRLVVENMNVIQNRAQQIRQLKKQQEISKKQVQKASGNEIKLQEIEQAQNILKQLEETKTSVQKSSRRVGQFDKYVTFQGLRRLMLQKNNFNPQIFRFEYLLQSLKQSFNNKFSRQLLQIIADSSLLGNLSEMKLNKMTLNPIGLKDLIQSAQLRNLSYLDLSDSNVDGKCLQLIGGCIFSYNLQKLLIANCKQITDWKYIIQFLNGQGIKDSENFDFQGFSNCFLENIELLSDTSFFSDLVQTHYFKFHMKYFNIFKYVNIFQNQSKQYKDQITTAQNQRQEELRNLDQKIKDQFDEKDQQNYDQKQKEHHQLTQSENAQHIAYEKEYGKLCKHMVKIFSNTPDITHQSKKKLIANSDHASQRQKEGKKVKTWSRSFDIARFFIDDQNLDVSNLIQDIDLMRIIKRYFTLQFFSLEHYTQLAKGINYLIQLPNNRFSSIYQIAYLKHPRFQQYISVGSIKYLAQELIQERQIGKNQIKAGYSLVTTLNFQENHYLSTYGLADFLQHSDYTKNWFQLNPDKDFDMNNLDFLTANQTIDDKYMNNYLIEILSACYGIQFINLSNQNLSDDFIIQLSKILNSEIVDDFPNLQEINISHNSRITHIGLKFLFANTLDRIMDGRLQIILRQEDSWDHKKVILKSPTETLNQINQAQTQAAIAASANNAVQNRDIVNNNVAINNQIIPEDNDEDDENEEKQIDQYDIIFEGKGKGRTVHYLYNQFTKKYKSQEDVVVQKRDDKVYYDENNKQISQSRFQKNQMIQYAQQRQRLESKYQIYKFKAKDKENQAKKQQNLGNFFQINEEMNEKIDENEDQDDKQFKKLKQKQLPENDGMLENEDDDYDEENRPMIQTNKTTSPENTHQSKLRKELTLLQQEEEEELENEDADDLEDEDQQFGGQYNEDEDDENQTLAALEKKIAQQQKERQKEELMALINLEEKKEEIKESQQLNNIPKPPPPPPTTTTTDAPTLAPSSDPLKKEEIPVQKPVQDEKLPIEVVSNPVEGEQQDLAKEKIQNSKDKQNAITEYKFHQVEGTNYELIQEYDKDLERISKDHKGLNRMEEEAEKLTMKIFIRQIVEIGVYHGINYTYRTYWKHNKGKLIFMTFLGLPFAIFQLYKILETMFLICLSSVMEQFAVSAAAASISMFIANKIRKTFKTQKQNQFELAEIIKPVPLCMQRQDKDTIFYFDNEVLLLNKYLSQNQFVLLNARTANGQIARNQFQWISYLKIILLINLILYYLLAIVYPIVITPDCNNPIWWQDLPYYGYAFIVFFLELILLFNISSIIASDKIFDIYSISTITSLYVSQVSQYDLYTDVLFASQIYYCSSQESLDLAIAAIIILSFNVIYTFFHLYNSFSQIRQISKMQQNWHSTNYVDEYARLCFLCEMHGLGTLLEKFSTSSSVSISSNWYVPELLRGLLIPQIMLSKFQRVFLEDIPQIVLQILYFTTRDSGNPLAWENMRVYLTSALSLLSSLGVAWDARPSLFDHSLFEELQFFFQLNQQQKLKLIQEEEKRAKIARQQQIGLSDEEEILVN